jgi:tetratricopeptide (TPR) repeat protein
LALAAPRVAFVGGLVLIALFAHQAQTRATLWQSIEYLDRDAIGNYPKGSSALYNGAVDAVKEGDHDHAIELLRAAADRGHFFIQPFRNEFFKPIWRDRRFKDLIFKIEGRRIAFARERGFHTQRQMIAVARSHEIRREHDEAIEVLEQVIRNVDSNSDHYLEEALASLERVRRVRDRRRLKSKD